MKAVLKSNRITVEYRFGHTVLTRMHKLDRYRSERERHGNIWTGSAALTAHNVEMLRDFGFEIDEKLTQWYDSTITRGSPVDMTKKIPELGGTLRDYQRYAALWIDSRDGRVLIADEMGLGKTVEALAWIEWRYKKSLPVLIVCPASVKIKWSREAKAWLEWPRVYIIEGAKPHRLRDDCDVYIINYDILGKWEVELKAVGFQTAVLDEAHAIKAPRSKRTKACLSICREIPHIIALSGTPVINRPFEFWNIISLIDPTLFPSQWEFVQRYCNPKGSHGKMDFNGSSHEKELHAKLSGSLFLRRLKADVLKDLPEKQRSIVPMHITNRKEYTHAEHDFQDWVRSRTDSQGNVFDEHDRVSALAKIEALKQLCVEGKMDEILDFIDDFVENGEKLVIATTHRKTVETILEEYGDVCVRLDGKYTGARRQKEIDRFQTDPKALLCVSNSKVLIGMDLTAASHIAFLELPWTPAEVDQAADRIHRFGQKAESVTIWFLVAEETIEDDIAALIDRKRETVTNILDGKDADRGSLLTELMRKIRLGV